jgi:hypothetical protein
MEFVRRNKKLVVELSTSFHRLYLKGICEKATKIYNGLNGMSFDLLYCMELERMQQYSNGIYEKI